MVAASFERRLTHGVDAERGTAFEHHVVGHVSQLLFDRRNVRAVVDDDEDIDVRVRSVDAMGDAPEEVQSLDCIQRFGLDSVDERVDGVPMGSVDSAIPGCCSPSYLNSSRLTGTSLSVVGSRRVLRSNP